MDKSELAGGAADSAFAEPLPGNYCGRFVRRVAITGVAREPVDPSVHHSNEGFLRGNYEPLRSPFTLQSAAKLTLNGSLN